MILERNAYESNGLNSPRTTLEFSFRAVPIFEASQFTAFLELNFFRSPTAGARGLLTSWASNPSGTTSVGTGILAVTCLAEGRGACLQPCFRKGPICFGGGSPGWSDLFCEQPRYRLGERSGIRDVIEWYTGFVHLLEDTRMGHHVHMEDGDWSRCELFAGRSIWHQERKHMENTKGWSHSEI